MRHFNYYENGGPFPSACVSCGANKNIYGLTRELLSGGEAQICETCIKELALFIGWAEEAPYEEAVAEAMKRNADLEQQLNNVPDHVEELINGIRSSVTDFIFAVSYSDSVPSAQDDEKPELSVAQPIEIGRTTKRSSTTPIKPAS